MRRFTISLLLVACFRPSSTEAGDIGQYEDDDFPAGACRDTGGEAGTGSDTDPCDTEGTTAGPGDLPVTTGSSEADRCMSSNECEGGYCAAQWDPETLQRTPLDCRFACVPTLDDASWCGDASACCDRKAICTRRGYCVLE